MYNGNEKIYPYTPIETAFILSDDTIARLEKHPFQNCGISSLRSIPFGPAADPRANFLNSYFNTQIESPPILRVTLTMTEYYSKNLEVANSSTTILNLATKYMVVLDHKTYVVCGSDYNSRLKMISTSNAIVPVEAFSEALLGRPHTLECKRDRSFATIYTQVFTIRFREPLFEF